MNTTCPETPPVVGTFLPHVMEPLHAEPAIASLGAVVRMASSKIDLAAERAAPADEAQDKVPDGSGDAARLLARMTQAAH